MSWAEVSVAEFGKLHEEVRRLFAPLLQATVVSGRTSSHQALPQALSYAARGKLKAIRCI